MLIFIFHFPFRVFYVYLHRFFNRFLSHLKYKTMKLKILFATIILLTSFSLAAQNK